MPQYLSTDPNAGREPAKAVYLSTDPNAGSEQPAAPEAPKGRTALESLRVFAGEATHGLNPVNINRTLQQAFWHPLDTARGLMSAQDQVRQEAVAAFRAGDTTTGVRKGIEWLIPLLGPRLNEASDAMQQGDYAKGLGATGDVSLQIAAPAIAKGMSRATSAIVEPKLRASGATDIKQALNPTRDRLKVKAERITPEVQSRGLVGTLEDLKAMASQNKSQYGAEIDATITRSANVPIDLAGVRKKIDLMKAKTYHDVKVPNPKPGEPTTTRAIHNPRKYQQIQNAEALIDQYGDTMTAEQAHSVRQAFDEVVARAGGFDEKAGSGAFGVSLADWSEANVKRPLSNALRRELAQAVPDLAAINREYGFWSDLEAVVKGTKTRKVGQQGGLVPKIAAVGARATGALAGYGTGGAGGAVAGALLSGEIAERFSRAVSSPKWKLQSAAVKTKLADALASGRQESVASVLGQIERAQGLAAGPLSVDAAPKTMVPATAGADRQAQRK